MKDKPIIISLILARGCSKGVPRKNLRLLAGKPLIYYAINPSLQSKYIQHTFLSTEDEEIAAVARQLGAEVIPRPMELAQDDPPDLPVLQHALNYLETKKNIFPDLIVFLRPTQPLRTVETIDKAISTLLETNVESVHTIHEAKEHPYWMNKIDDNGSLIDFFPGGWNYTRRQDLPKVYKSNGLVDVMTRDLLMVKCKKRGDTQKAVITETKLGVDIDTEFDLLVAEALVKGVNNREV